MYKSPIEIIVEQLHGKIEMDMENGIMKAIQKYNIDVDKKELLKALQYDREQYEKGYDDGYDDGFNADKWTLCKVEQPKEYGGYLYTDKNDEVHEGWYAPPNKGYIRGWSTCEADGFVKLSDDEVIAWQPLPQPYREDKQ